MPKAPMSRAEIENIRGRILDSALEIIIEEGFNNLSTRKIARRLGITATTIYNYYTNMDELNLMIRVRGFKKLYDLLIERQAAADNAEDRLRAMIRAYIEFGLKNPNYYDIMFNLHTPKYLDYVGTDMEPAALIEKNHALKCHALFLEIIHAYMPGPAKGKDPFILFQTAKFWSSLHGLVTLNNCRLFHEVMEQVEPFIEELTADVIRDIVRLKEPIASGAKLQ